MNALTPCRKLRMMSPAVTAVKTVRSLRNTKTNTPSQTSAIIGGKKMAKAFAP